MLKLPRLYAILDVAVLPPETDIVAYASELADCGIDLMQYRNKNLSASRMLLDARRLANEVRSHFPEVRLIMNDRADLCLAAGFNGVHVGQEDLPIAATRKLCAPPLIIGISTHNMEQLEAADATDADYIAIGPVFATASKSNPDPEVGIKGVTEARKRTNKPLVAIGGITAQNCRSVIDAGADSVALISALITEPRKSAEAFFLVLG